MKPRVQASRRTAIGWIVGAGLFAVAPRGFGQRMPRVVVMGPMSRDAAVRWFSEEGFVDGRSIVVDHVGLKGEPRAAAEGLLASRPDLILVPGGEDIALFKSLTASIPIVFYSFGGDPERLGLVRSLSRPGGNITGTMNYGVEVGMKGWELLRAFRPSARRIGTLWDDQYVHASWVPQLREANRAQSKATGLENVEIVIPVDKGFPVVESALRQARVDLLEVIGADDWPWRAALYDFVESARIPVLWEHPGDVRKRGLISVLGSFQEASREAVRMAARILRGTHPSGIPVYRVNHLDVVVNVRAARAIGLEVPDAVRVAATEVVGS